MTVQELAELEAKLRFAKGGGDVPETSYILDVAWLISEVRRLREALGGIHRLTEGGEIAGEGFPIQSDEVQAIAKKALEG